ncbi:MAG: TolC family protein [Muribaculaceae bacterium]|nr:TolC family protein [Muribaculaceae bacterium]
MRRLQTLTALLVCCGAFNAGADTWSYSDCVNYAREHNISLRKSQLTEQTSAISLDEAKARWQPTLDFATSHGFTNTPFADDNKNSYSSSYGLNAGWTIWNGGERENTIKLNELRQRIDRLNTDDIMRSLETDLLQVYFNILYAKESIDIYEQAVKLSKAQADRAHALMEAGKVSKVDYAQLQSQYEQDRYNLVNARGTYDTRRMELKKLLELGIDTDIQLADLEWSTEQVMAALPDISESYRLATLTDLRLRSLELEIDGSDLDIAIAKSSGLPQLSLNAGVGTGYAAPGLSFSTAIKRNLNESVGLTLAVPILNNKKTKAAVARANVQKIDAQLDIDQRRTELAQLVENWYIDTRSAQSRYEAALIQQAASELSNELTTAQFDLGLVNPVELMTAHNNLTEANRTVLQAKYMAMLGQKMIEFYRTSTISLL